MVAEEVALSEEVEVLEEADLPVVDEVPEEVDLLEEVVGEEVEMVQLFKLDMDPLHLQAE